jgi:hypothetical protein
MKKQLLTILALSAIAVSTMAQVPNYVPSTGLVGWWPFNGNANDESGSGNNGAITGATLTQDRDGNSNAAYAFDGVNDLIDCGNITTMNGLSEMTVSVWFYSLGNVFYSRILGKEQEQDDQHGFTLQYSTNTGNYLRVNMRNNVNAQGDNSTIAINNNEWYHIVMVFNGNGATDADRLKLYVNNTIISLSYSNTIPSTTSNNSYPLWIGNQYGNPALSPWHGNIDDIGIWNVALTEEEVTDLYEAQGGPCLSAASATFSGLETNYTISDNAASLVGSPSGGVFFGEGVSGNQFDPAAAGVGSHSVVYTVVDVEGCISSYGLCTNVDLNVGIGGVNIGTDGGVDVYPNPSTGQYTLELHDLEGLVSYIVYDSRGREVSIGSLIASGNRTQHNIDLNTKAKGIYTLQLNTASGTHSRKLVKD